MCCNLFSVSWESPASFFAVCSCVFVCSHKSGAIDFFGQIINDSNSCYKGRKGTIRQEIHLYRWEKVFCYFMLILWKHKMHTLTAELHTAVCNLWLRECNVFCSKGTVIRITRKKHSQWGSHKYLRWNITVKSYKITEYNFI